VEVPKGIDPGFGYNVGEAAYGRNLSDQAMDAWRASAEAWEPLPFGGAAPDRPARIELDAPRASLGPRLSSIEEMSGALRGQLGGEEKVYRVANLPVLVNADTLARHVDPARSEYLPLLHETLRDPFEAWLSFERHKGTGQVALRARVMKGFDLGRGRGVLVVANAVRGVLEAWTLIPTSDRKYLNRQRRGKLLYGR
jgi:hypothetical protein